MFRGLACLLLVTFHMIAQHAGLGRNVMTDSVLRPFRARAMTGKNSNHTTSTSMPGEKTGWSGLPAEKMLSAWNAATIGFGRPRNTRPPSGTGQ